MQSNMPPKNQTVLLGQVSRFVYSSCFLFLFFPNLKNDQEFHIQKKDPLNIQQRVLCAENLKIIEFELNTRAKKNCCPVGSIATIWIELALAWRASHKPKPSEMQRPYAVRMKMMQKRTNARHTQTREKQKHSIDSHAFRFVRARPMVVVVGLGADSTFRLQFVQEII